MVQGRRIAAILATLTAVLLCVGGSAGALTLGGTTTTLPTTTTTVTVPSVSTPTVSAPTVTTPKVSTPVATTPTVTTPKVTTPKVSTPTVTTPKVSVPKVSTPKVSTPTLSTPKAISKVTSSSGSGQTSLPGGISLGGGGGGTATGIAGTGTATVGGILSTGGTTRSGTVGGLLASPGGTSGSGTNAIAGFPVFGGPGGGGPGGAPGGFPPGSYGGGIGGGPTALAVFPGFAGPGAVHLTALQALVASLAGCFYALTPFEQQVLVVRTGIDGRQPVSRTMLAGALGMTPAQLQRTERTAVRELRHASTTDGCMPFAAAASLFTAASAFVGGPFGPLGYVTPALATAGRPGLLAATSSGGPSLAGGTTSLAERLAGLEDGGKAGPLWMIVLISLMFFLAAAALGREVRRSVH